MILEERNYSVYSTLCLIRTLAICLNFLQQKVFQNNFVRFFSNPILIKCILAPVIMQINIYIFTTKTIRIYPQRSITLIIVATSNCSLYQLGSQETR